MRYLILSDIHSNIEALEAVLAAAEMESPDKYILLGDIVGYGASPNAVTETVRSLKPLAGIRGNHDKVVTEVDEGENFRGYAREAALWTRERLSIANRDFLQRLVQGPESIDQEILISHGSPHDEDFYILTEMDATAVLVSSQYQLTFFGHTHIPFVGCLLDGSRLEAQYAAKTEDFKLLKDRRYLINPGSVGQPRDENPHASFAILDTDANVLTVHRIPYNIQKAQRKIREAGLDPFLADRLAEGR